MASSHADKVSASRNGNVTLDPDLVEAATRKARGEEPKAGDTPPGGDGDFDGRLREAGRFSRTQHVNAMFVKDDPGDRWIVPYSRVGFQNTGRDNVFFLIFEDAKDGTPLVMTFTGNPARQGDFDLILAYIASGTAQYVHPGSIVASIRVEKVEG
jgi:hypothetical protein